MHSSGFGLALFSVGPRSLQASEECILHSSSFGLALFSVGPRSLQASEEYILHSSSFGLALFRVGPRSLQASEESVPESCVPIGAPCCSCFLAQNLVCRMVLLFARAVWA